VDFGPPLSADLGKVFAFLQLHAGVWGSDGKILRNKDLGRKYSEMKGG
jgi:hypothetical protein